MFSGAALMLALVLASGPGFADDRVLGVAAPFEITGTDPSISGHVFTNMEVAETLLEVDPAGRPLPNLATAWSAADDATTWRFALRDGVSFHDGSPMTAAAVAESLRHARSKPGILAQAPIEAIEPAGGEVIIRLSEPFAPLLAGLAHTSTQILAPASYAANGEATAVIGTGPYRVAVLEPPQRLVVERFDGYWGEPPAVARASYLAAGRGETRALLAESGDAKLVFTLDPASYARLRNNARLDLHSVSIPRTLSLKVNAGHPVLGDPRARQALSLAIDRAGIAAAILRHPEAAAGQLFPPSLGQWHQPDLPPLTRDLAQAKLLLADLGWSPGNGGILERAGRPLHLTLRTYPDRPELPPIAAALQDQFREVGIDLEVSIGNSSEIPAGHQDGSLEIALIARNFALIPDPLGTLLQDFGPAGGDWGAMNWSNGEMVEAMAGLMRGTDADATAVLRAKAVRVLQDDLPVIPIAWYQHTAAVSKSLANVTIDPFERSYGISRIRWAD
jgi:peptide/nickel transport system substrate-binding protein